MEIKGPLVSVLICTYNAEQFLEATMRSVMNQSYSNMEILVRDNNSSDGTVRVLERIGREESRLRFYKGRENLGPYGGLNYLLERAAGKYIAIQDHDDIWHTDKISKQVSFLELNGVYKGCGTAMVNYFEKHNVFLLRRQRPKSTTGWHTSLVFRNEGKFYDSSLKVGNDFFFMKNILCRNVDLIYNLPEPYLLRRIRKDARNLSSLWSRSAGVTGILKARLSLIDTACMLNRLVMPEGAVAFLAIHLFFRKSILRPEQMKNDCVLSDYLALAGPRPD